MFSYRLPPTLRPAGVRTNKSLRISAAVIQFGKFLSRPRTSLWTYRIVCLLLENSLNLVAEVGFVGYHRDPWLRNERGRGAGRRRKKEEEIVKSCFDVTDYREKLLTFRAVVNWRWMNLSLIVSRVGRGGGWVLVYRINSRPTRESALYCVEFRRGGT